MTWSHVRRRWACGGLIESFVFSRLEKAAANDYPAMTLGAITYSKWPNMAFMILAFRPKVSLLPLVFIPTLTLYHIAAFRAVAIMSGPAGRTPAVLEAIKTANAWLSRLHIAHPCAFFGSSWGGSDGRTLKGTCEDHRARRDYLYTQPEVSFCKSSQEHGGGLHVCAVQGGVLSVEQWLLTYWLAVQSLTFWGAVVLMWRVEAGSRAAFLKVQQSAEASCREEEPSWCKGAAEAKKKLFKEHVLRCVAMHVYIMVTLFFALSVQSDVSWHSV
jgi:hypothetical protein